MKRSEFLKKIGLGALAVAIFGKETMVKEADAALVSVSASDNLSPKLVKGTTAPANTNNFWIDTSLGGVLKYYNGTAWVAVKSTWG